MKLMRYIVAAAGCVTLLMAASVYAADQKVAQKDLVLRGDAKCTACHDEADAPEVLSIGKTRHGTVADGRTPSCASCHGESNAHANHKGSDKPPKPDVSFGKTSKTDPSVRNDMCLTCHQGGKRNNWQGGIHANRDVTCASCHKVHHGVDKVRSKETQTEVCFTCHKEQRNQIVRPSHHPIVEGKMACSSCHDVHGDNPKMLVKSSTNETCYTCHMEKRGPFLHNHQPVSEDCGICHNPHGTTAANMLKSRPPFLCHQCHDGTSHVGQMATLPADRKSATQTAQVGTVARGCANCHINIHGSNSSQNAVTAERFRR